LFVRVARAKFFLLSIFLRKNPSFVREIFSLSDHFFEGQFKKRSEEDVGGG